MNIEEKKEIMDALITSPDFLSALNVCKSQLPKNREINLNEIAIWFFSQGYISRMEYEESKSKFITRPYLISKNEESKGE